MIPARRTAMLLAALALCGTVGCRPKLETGYGRADDPGYRQSVNGTAVLREMVRQRGHRVFSWDRLSPSLARRADAIVWFPDDTAPPPHEVVLWVERWLDSQPGRTLVYVLRDFDAEQMYWSRVRPTAPPDQRPLIDARRAAAQHAYERSTIREPLKHAWFRVDEIPPRRPVQQLTGDPRWLAGIDPSRTEIELNSRLRPRRLATRLLQSGEDVLVARQPLGRGQLILVANASFLLNLPLVNHEHRKLAGKLIDAVGPEAKTVAFLESGRGGPEVVKDEPRASPPSGLALFAVWPLSWILAHLMALGMLFAFSRWPIFGRPRTPEPEPASDFGRHVAALAEHFRRTGDQAYAQSQIDRFLGPSSATAGESREQQRVARASAATARR